LIPRIIHQTWRDSDIPETLRAFAGTWRRHHPDWSYRLWTDADLADLVERQFPEFAAMFHGYPQPIMRADLGRYLVLKAHGGVYADLDAEAVRPWDGLLATERPVLFEEPASHAALEFVRRRDFSRIVSNAVVASPPEHPFWDHLVALLRRCRHARSPLDATGPLVLTAAVDGAPAAIAPEILPARMAATHDSAGAALPAPGTGEAEPPLADHHWVGTWWRGGQSWPAGYGEDQQRKTSWYERWRDRIARRRLAESLAAARTLSPDVPPPRGERVRVAMPVRDASRTLDRLLDALDALDHPKRSMSLAFLESNSADDSFARLDAFARSQQSRYARIALRRDRLRFPQLERRWEPAVQRARRAHLARVRNRLLRWALRDEDWVLWLDSDVIAFPPHLIAGLRAAEARVVQPNAVLAPGGPSFDMNGWIAERALGEDAMRPYLLDGLYQPPLGYHRLYLSDLRYREQAPLDSVGGAALLVDAGLHRAGILFPETPYRHLIETEGFGAILRDHGVGIAGLPNLEVLHADT
jgi:hypothetical protein